MDKKLTFEQQRVIKHKHGHAIVTAVPGSGKTTTLVIRVAQLLSSGVPANEILILMFNKDARKSFSEKLQETISKKNLIGNPQIKTFDSYAKQVVDQAELAGEIETKMLSVSGEGKFIHDALLKECLGIGSTSSNGFVDFSALEDITLKIDKWRINDVEPEDLESGPEYKHIPKSEKRAYSHYCENISSRGIRTFDDQMNDAIALIKKNALYKKNLTHIIVDEYQDVNHRQHQFIKCLCNENTSVMVVGDVNQCIYKFRGSNPDFINGIFQREFSNVTELRLSNTFRFGHQLAYLSNTLIYKNNKGGNLCISHVKVPKTLVSLQDETKLNQVLSKVSTATKERLSTGIIARTNADLLFPILCLRLLNIPFTTGENRKLSLRTVPIIEFIIITLLVSLGDTTLKRMRNLLDKNFTKNFCRLTGLEIDKNAHFMFSTTTKYGNQCFIDVLSRFLSNEENFDNSALKNLKRLKGKYSFDSEASSLISELELSNLLDKVGLSSGSRIESNDESRSLKIIIDTIRQQKLSVGNLLDLFVSSSSSQSAGADINVMTIHKAKGLEWDNVIMVGLNDQSFPANTDSFHSKPKEANDEDGSLEEERRLFYVAITRAKKRLYLLHPKDTQLDKWLQKGWYSTPKKEVTASRFLFEMDYTHAARVQCCIDDSLSTKGVDNKLALYYINKVKYENT
jgi:DNA helicase-2/ATP-dependent DNA helicase PcrA